MVRTQVMGIVNVTPDSFFDGGRHFSTDKAFAHAEKLIEQGADILDIGGESTRPGAEPVSLQEELSRVVPLICNIQHPQISIDTRKPEVALEAVQAGATLINDVEGFRNPKMRQVAKECDVKICVMHMQGEPTTMQQRPHYKTGVVPGIIQWFREKIDELLHEGISDSNIILDPGIGFGKTVEDNLQILQNLDKFKALGYPVLVGVSRKSFIQKILNKGPAEILPATLAANCFCCLQGVDIIRVHDVFEHVQAVQILEKMEAHG